MTQLQKGVGSLQANLPKAHPSPGHLAQARTAGGEKPTGRGRRLHGKGDPCSSTAGWTPESHSKLRSPRSSRLGAQKKS